MTGCKIKCRPTTDINIEDVCYKLNFLGQVVSFTGSVSGSAITIGSLSATYEENMAYLDVSSYVDDDKDYIPIVVTNVSADEKEARKTLNSICWYYRSSKKVQLLFTDTTYQVANSIQYGVSLIPTNSVSDGDNVKGITDGLDNLIDGFQTLSNLVTSLSSASTDTQYPSAKCVYDALQNAGGGEGISIKHIGATYTSVGGIESATINVASYVEEGKAYYPIVSVYGQQDADYRDCIAALDSCSVYEMTSKTVRLWFSNDFNRLNSTTYVVTLVPIDLIDSAQSTYCWGITNGAAYTQSTANLVTSLSGSSTDTQYPSAKCVYDIIGDVETLINAL